MSTRFCFEDTFACAIIPVGLLADLALLVLHDESLLALLARADIGAVAAAEAVEHINLLHETHAREGLADGRNRVFLAERSSSHLSLVEHKRTDASVGADI